MTFLLVLCEFIYHNLCMAGLDSSVRLTVSCRDSPVKLWCTLQSSTLDLGQRLCAASLPINLLDSFLALTKQFRSTSGCIPEPSAALLKLWTSLSHQYETCISWHQCSLNLISVLFWASHMLSLLCHKPYCKTRFLSLRVVSAFEQIHTHSNLSCQIYPKVELKKILWKTFHLF